MAVYGLGFGDRDDRAFDVEFNLSEFDVRHRNHIVFARDVRVDAAGGADEVGSPRADDHAAAAEQESD